MGFCLVVVALNIVVLLLVPAQTHIEKSGTVTEYQWDDEAFAVRHDYRIDGAVTKAAFGPPAFSGVFYISGIDGLEEELTLVLNRKDGRWEGCFRDEAGQSISTAILDIEADKSFENIAVLLGAYTREQSAVTVVRPLGSEHFLCPDASTRQQAAYRFQSFFGS